MLAFDRRGFRLGYGAGFYDRTLERVRASKPVLAVGLAYAGQEMGRVPVGPHDEPLDWVVTELGATRLTEDR
jgi:5-formyltetrahydrofolate cyclo-ligase